jgi:hypothetical protein
MPQLIKYKHKYIELKLIGGSQKTDEITKYKKELTDLITELKDKAIKLSDKAQDLDKIIYNDNTKEVPIPQNENDKLKKKIDHDMDEIIKQIEPLLILHKALHGKMGRLEYNENTPEGIKTRESVNKNNKTLSFIRLTLFKLQNQRNEIISCQNGSECDKALKWDTEIRNVTNRANVTKLRNEARYGKSANVKNNT